MRGITLKITLMVAALIIIAVVAMTYASVYNTGSLFYSYMMDSIKLNDAYPIIKNGRLVLGPAEKEFLMEIVPKIATAGIPIVLVGILLSFLIVRQTMSPIRKLSKGATEIAKGNFEFRVKSNAKGELGTLVKAFNEMAEELAKSQYLRKEFFADVAHEIKTPIAVLKGNLEGMLDDVIPADKVMLKSLKEEVDFLANMVEDIKHLAIADTGNLRLEKEEVNINEVISACKEQLTAIAAVKKINVEFEFREDPIIALVDRDKIHKVVYNLLINAGKYTLAGGSVRAITEKIQKDGVWYFQICIEDNGIGIAPVDIPNLFERFYRADKSRTRNTGGVGLGLSIVKKMVELHDGKVWVESELHKGSRFYVLIPIKREVLC